MGRFINEDTYEGETSNPLSMNLYTYVGNNPLIYIDPSGHASEGHVVGTLVNLARQDGTNAAYFWTHGFITP
ncbi:RHS repeat-associated core domain-containing protein [Paenibacillus sp. 2TAB23]